MQLVSPVSLFIQQNLFDACQYKSSSCTNGVTVNKVASLLLLRWVLWVQSLHRQQTHRVSQIVVISLGVVSVHFMNVDNVSRDTGQIPCACVSFFIQTKRNIQLKDVFLIKHNYCKQVTIPILYKRLVRLNLNNYQAYNKIIILAPSALVSFWRYYKQCLLLLTSVLFLFNGTSKIINL